MWGTVGPTNAHHDDDQEAIGSSPSCGVRFRADGDVCSNVLIAASSATSAKTSWGTSMGNRAAIERGEP